MGVSAARAIAFDILKRVATQASYADELLRSHRGKAIRPEDSALATELTLGVLRWLRLLDFLIARHMNRASGTLDIEVRIALRLGVYQLCFLNRVPAHAAVHESVELTKRARKKSAAPMVNAILRKIAAEATPSGQAPHTLEPLLPKDIPPGERLGILYSHPDWLVERWLRNFGEERARGLLETNNRVPNVTCAILDERDRKDACASLREAGCAVEPGRLLRGALRLQGGNPASSKVVRAGRVIIQDEASQAVARLLEVRPEQSVLDLCAAPGGKTLILVQAAGRQGRVVATDIHDHRVRAMKERFERSGFGYIDCLRLDATEPLPFETLFDRILVDAPCSGTGTLARNPDIRWRLCAEDLNDLHGRQVALLHNALARLAKNGRLVYSTCSLEPEENESVVDQALQEAQRTFRIVPLQTVLAPLLRQDVRPESMIGPDGFFRTWPPEHGTDGFFAAVIERPGDEA